MKYILLIIIFFFVVIEKQMAQKIELTKEEVLKILSKIPQSMYIRLEYDMGAIEGKIFKDKKN